MNAKFYNIYRAPPKMFLKDSLTEVIPYSPLT